MSIPSFVIAFFAGLLSFFAPCGAVLLPSFFAHTFKKRSSILVATCWFLLGFLTLFIPVGFGVRTITRLLLLHREEVTLIGGLLLFALAGFALVGKGLHVPVPAFLTKHGFHNDALSSYLIGVVFGITAAGCTAPLLGLTFTLALLAKSKLASFVILAAYGIGIAMPLFTLAFVADRTEFLKKPFFKGKVWTFKLGGKERMLHSTNLISATVLAALGTLFIVSHGTFFMSGFGGADSALTDFNVGAADFLAKLKYGSGR